jgi:hypothetical protein
MKNISLSEKYEIQRRETEQEFIRVNMLQREYNRLKLLESRIDKLEKTIQYVRELETEPGLILGELREMGKTIENTLKLNNDKITEIIQELDKLTKKKELTREDIKRINALQDIVNAYENVDSLKSEYIKLTESYKDNVAFAKKYFENNPLDSQDYMEMRNSLLYGEYEMLRETLEGVKFIKTAGGEIIVDNREYQRLRAISDRTKSILEAEREPPPKKQNTTISNFKVF